MAVKERQRLDKLLTHMGFGTRKEIKKLIKEKRVQVNGELAREPGLHVIPGRDHIDVDGEPLEYRQYIYLMLNKPQGVLSATEDRLAKVVVDLLPPRYRAFHPFPVGRLDKDAEGLLLLTNDGKLAHQLLSPKKHVPKTYYAVVCGMVTEIDVEAFRQGIILDDGYRTMPGELKILCPGPEAEVELTIYEGKYHQVKRMFAALGKKVTYLKRIAMGSLVLDEQLKPGEYRELTAEEIGKLRELNPPTLPPDLFSAKI
ncbi:Pseudouridine synthase, RsuA/RluB/E/F [Moorella glycerini]|uniref:Pseudouridine synthase n=1 Tax=Neomoorella stamsii TaxID=1266720 RepID=A0A9X7J3E9_9FIRM|nr:MULTISPECIES: pseudouridine synthase [Moorella]PRR73517.1 Ribosomal large subunit pseudouridine synthase B [Moorella stamsii]CEP69286.1 Pseudouridine synthase, RsuA/RluB/E/F [Moorella glycerini]